MANINILEQARQSYRQQAWADAYNQLEAADRKNPLDPEDLKCLARAAYLVGKDKECTDIWTRAHHDYLSRGNTKQAACCAFWLGLILFNKGERARGGGWIARAKRLVEGIQHDCVEEGLLLVPAALGCLSQGDAARAYTLFTQAEEIGNRFNNPDLITLGRLGKGQALIRQDKIAGGVTLLDEAMVAVESDEVSPLVAGIVYCAVIETCQKIYDLSRAQEWTKALSHWCESQPDLVPYRGQCLVRRVEIMQFHGLWPEAMNEVKQACDRLSGPPGEPAAGEAFYQQAELYRLKGEFTKAEEAYRQASKWGRKPQPGLALLRLTQGRIKAAEAAIRRVADEAQGRITQSRILPAYVEIMLAADDAEAARTATDELSEIAAVFKAPFLQAIAAQSQGAVLLAEKNIRPALDALRKAWTAWEKLEAPYESARVRLLIGLSCRELGDEDTAEMEFNAARWTFDQLEAAPDIAIVDSLIQRKTVSDSVDGLTQRELQILHRVATGKTNKDIATELFISERTVDRHVSNILAKLDVSSRTAATAYAYEHKLI